MPVNEYCLKIKSICESLASINEKVEDDNKVEVCLRGLGPQYKISQMMMDVGIVENQAIHRLNVIKNRMMRKEKRGSKITLFQQVKAKKNMVLL